MIGSIERLLRRLCAFARARDPQFTTSLRPLPEEREILALIKSLW
jgi:hypothetical protein